MKKSEEQDWGSNQETPENLFTSSFGRHQNYLCPNGNLVKEELVWELASIAK